ncbi:hypothetical protein RRG08_018304 [Elysia crispata]|uniref:Uncharacterized protein n=1 Tax=Elysia crispata TaxID=231223 RepID=A0AAE0YK10_9GAST|nr:hypothetical protein RRG08_018304 [Elysia crispata]
MTVSWLYWRVELDIRDVIFKGTHLSSVLLIAQTRNHPSDSVKLVPKLTTSVPCDQSFNSDMTQSCYQAGYKIMGDELTDIVEPTLQWWRPALVLQRSGMRKVLL